MWQRVPSAAAQHGGRRPGAPFRRCPRIACAFHRVFVCFSTTPVAQCRRAARLSGPPRPLLPARRAAPRACPFWRLPGPSAPQCPPRRPRRRSSCRAPSPPVSRALPTAPCNAIRAVERTPCPMAGPLWPMRPPPPPLPPLPPAGSQSAPSAMRSKVGSEWPIHSYTRKKVH